MNLNGNKAWVKGKSGNPRGRPKGSKNLYTKDLISQILKIEKKLPMQKKLLALAEDNPQWFYEKIWTRILPRNVEMDVRASEALQVIVKNYKDASKPTP
jgi:hypothetical protein